MPVFCKFCNFSAFDPRKLVNHLRLHSGLDFKCGVDGCSRVYNNLNSFKSHLYRHHDYFYPLIQGQNPDISDSNVFSYRLSVLNNSLIDPIDPNQDFVSQENEIANCDSPFNLTDIPNNDLQFHEYSKNFLKILLDNGCKYNIPFECLKNLTQSILSLVSTVKDNNCLDDSLLHNFNTIVSSTDRFDQFLGKYFDLNSPEVINIGNTGESFILFSLKKSLQFLLSKFEAPDQILFNTHITQCENTSYKSFFDSETSLESDTIYLNIFVDDFQVANPLLKKKSLKHSLTGIYFRILTKNQFNYSKYENIHLLSLIRSSIFNAHSSEIFEYISRELNDCLNSQQLFYIFNQPYLLSIKIGFFSCDSLSAANLLGLKKSFNHYYCCRFCLCPKQEFSKKFCEKDADLRASQFFENAYNRCLDLMDNQDYFGIIKKSCLRYINSPILSELFPPCIDHDIFEGILPKIVSFSLKYFVNSGFLSYQIFKNKISSFKFLGKDKSNFPLFEFEKHFKIKFTADEGYTFIRFTLIFLHSVPRDDNVHILLKIFTKIVLIMMSFSISSESIVILDNLIENFLSICSIYDSDLKMTVKFHHLLHYPRFITLFGPPRLFSTRNFESMHSYLKAKIKNSKNWKLVPLTIASKYSRDILSNKNYKIKEFGLKACVSTVHELVDLFNSDNLSDVFSLISLHFHNIKYFCNRSVILFKVSENNTLYLLINKIFKKNNSYIFFGDIFDSYYDEDLSIIILKKLDFKEKIWLEDLVDFHSYELYSNTSCKYIVPYFITF